MVVPDPMIHYNEVVALLSAACPTFANSPQATVFGDHGSEVIRLGRFVDHLARLVEDDDTSSLPAVFGVIDWVLDAGDHAARRLVTEGFIEDLARAVWSLDGRRLSLADFVSWMGPRARCLVEARLSGGMTDRPPARAGCAMGTRYVQTVEEAAAASTVTRLIQECLNHQQLDRLHELVAPDVVVHQETPCGVPDAFGAEELREVLKTSWRVFPDLHMAVEQLIVKADVVVVRWTAHGTHLAEWHGRPATERHVRFGGIHIYRLEGGRIREWWRNEDLFGLLEQINGAAVPMDGAWDNASDIG
jgi:steroid delta-isomerase-like uncharacterized protein